MYCIIAIEQRGVAKPLTSECTFLRNSKVTKNKSLILQEFSGLDDCTW